MFRDEQLNGATLMASALTNGAVPSSVAFAGNRVIDVIVPAMECVAGPKLMGVYYRGQFSSD